MRSIAALLSLALWASAGAAAAGPVVETASGRVEGREMPGGGAAFRGLPFAAPPIGPLRWRPTMPPASWSGVRPAVDPPAACLQLDWGWNTAIAAQSSEDCLYLDIRTPDLHPQVPLPVLVWIHGGSNRAGGAMGTVESDITAGGVVLVALQYRLDALGFLSLPALTAESPDHASGNYGLMDQIAGLRWVRDNIRKFGGDPAKVTIFGESAGGQDVGLLMLAGQARGLFRGAIEESGTAGFGLPPRPLPENEGLGTALEAKLGVTGLDAMRAVDGRALMKAATQLQPPSITDSSFIWLQPVIDGVVVTERPDATLTMGGEAPVPLIIGSNARELGLYGGPPAIEATIGREFGKAGPVARAFYAHAADPLLGDEAIQLATDLTFRCPAVRVARLHHAGGNRVWQYEFALADPDGLVRHTSELAYVFQARPEMAPLQAYWTRFARTGDPNGEGLPAWPEFGEAGHYLAFEPWGPRIGQDLRGSLCRLLDRV